MEIATARQKTRSETTASAGWKEEYWYQAIALPAYRDLEAHL